MAQEEGAPKIVWDNIDASLVGENLLCWEGRELREEMFKTIKN